MKGTGKMYRECGFPRSARNRVLGAVGVLHLVEERGDLLARNIPMLEKNGEMYRML